MENHYRLIAVDLSRQKKLDADPKANQQIEFVEQLKKLNMANNNAESTFVLTILEKNNNEEMGLKLSEGSVKVL